MALRGAARGNGQPIHFDRCVGVVRDGRGRQAGDGIRNGSGIACSVSGKRWRERESWRT